VPGRIEASWQCLSAGMAMAATRVGGEGKNEAAADVVGPRRSSAAARQGVMGSSGNGGEVDNGWRARTHIC
jgi:hypothetical protein